MLSAIMARFSARVASITSSTCSVQLFPKMVTIGVSASKSAFKFGSLSGRFDL